MVKKNKNYPVFTSFHLQKNLWDISHVTFFQKSKFKTSEPLRSLHIIIIIIDEY